MNAYLPRANKIFLLLLLLTGLLLILVINREFGLADNGDFSRYFGPYASKPSSLNKNWPLAGTQDWNYRFFSQPIMYWSIPQDSAQSSWFTSMKILWKVGSHLNRLLYSKSILNIKLLSLPLFMLHALFFTISFRSRSGLTAKTYMYISIILLVFTDARVTSFYNSFYTESACILSLFGIFALSFNSMSTSSSEKLPLVNLALLIASCFMLLIFTVFSKLQYLYLLVPITILIWYGIRASKLCSMKSTFFLTCFLTCILCAMVAYSIVRIRSNHPGQATSSRINSYNSLYCGILQFSEKKEELIRKLGLPDASVQYIGLDVWHEDRQKFVWQTNNLSIKTYIKSIVFEPKAFVKLLFVNSKEVGNFKTSLGMVPEEKFGSTPLALSITTEFSTLIAGPVLILCVCGSGTFLVFYSRNLPTDRRAILHMLISVLFSIFILDLIVSTFDGIWEVRKHLIAASTSGLLLLIAAIATPLLTQN